MPRPHHARPREPHAHPTRRSLDCRPVRRERARAQCDERRSNDAGAAGGGTNGDVSANDGETESSSCTAARGDKDTAAARGAKEAEGSRG